MSIYMGFFLFMLYSFIGWCMETLYCAFLDKKFSNRGFLIGPICPIYGFGAIGIILFAAPHRSHPIAVFFITIIVCSILEYVTSYLMEKFFKARWWDYSKEKFNINGRICLKTMLEFGLVALLVIYALNPLVMNVVNLIPPTVIEIVSITLFVLFIIDIIISSVIIFKFKNTVKNYHKDSTDEINTYVKNELSNKVLYRRLVNAFPNFKAKVKEVIENALEPIIKEK